MERSILMTPGAGAIYYSQTIILTETCNLPQGEKELN
jgi:hypothetical protein